ncbi:MAG: response regulator [Deltaproteobacteria bacterium]|nr:MAG: response regulator [Deltaproteobacteria bacterium]
MRIVLVEDNLQLATTIAEGLTEDGYTVHSVATAAGAIERGMRRDLDLMVLDLGLPGCSPRATRSMPGSRRSTPAPTITWSSRSRSPSWSRGSRRSPAGPPDRAGRRRAMSR